jgi:hypothetical protein
LPTAHPFIGILFAVIVAMMFTLSGSVLWDFGLNYSGLTGAAASKIHPATYLAFATIGLLILARRNPVSFFVKLVTRYPGALVFLIAIALLGSFIVIDDRDSPPLEVSGIKAEGNVYEVVYLAGPDGHNQLLYGSADAEPASYDTVALQELLRERFRPAQAELGAQLSRPGNGVSSAFPWSKLLNNPRLLGGVITLLVIVLGWGLYRAIKRMDKLPSE